MRLFELEANDLTTANYDPAADKFNARRKGETRKTELYLKDINRLKKIRARRRLEDLKRQDLLGVMYGGAGGDQGGAGGPGGMF